MQSLRCLCSRNFRKVNLRTGELEEISPEGGYLLMVKKHLKVYENASK